MPLIVDRASARTSLRQILSSSSFVTKSVQAKSMGKQTNFISLYFVPQ